MAVGNKEDQLTVLDVRTRKQIAKQKFYYEVNDISWTTNADYILAATGGGEMGCVDLISFKLGDSDKGHLAVCESMPAHCSNCYNLRVDPTGARMAVGGVDYLVSLWDLSSLVCHHAVSLE